MEVTEAGAEEHRERRFRGDSGALRVSQERGPGGYRSVQGASQVPFRIKVRERCRPWLFQARKGSGKGQGEGKC